MANYRAIARRAATRYGINPDYFVRQIQAESGFNPRARSPAGALGIAQIMPATARGWGVDPMNPAAALDAAARAMSRYLRSYRNDWRLALAAYNAGPGAVRRYGGVPPYSETRTYIHRVLGGGRPIDTYRPGQGGASPPRRQPGGYPALLAMLGGQAPQIQSGPLELRSPRDVLRSLSPELASYVQPAQGLAPNPYTAQGVTSGELYDQLGAIRRRLLTA